jgi:cytochrome P450
VNSLDLVDLNLADPQTFLSYDLHQLWRSLQNNSPVHWNLPRGSESGFWVVTRYKDIIGVYKDNARFTSAKGNVLSTLLQGYDSSSGKMLSISDGQRHRLIRKLILESFTPKALAPILEKVKSRTHRQVAEAVETGYVDFAEVANRVPISIIGELLNVPENDREQLSKWSILALSRAGERDGQLDEVVVRNEILMYFLDLVEERRRDPGDDVISSLASGRVDGEPLSDEEIVLNCYSLTLSDQSVRMSSVGGALALAAHPEQWRAFKNGLVGVETAVDEVLRWTTPSMHFGRRATVDTMIGGQAVAANDIVTLWNAAGNMDADVFAHPVNLDLGRKPNKHLSFGYGPHFCVGASLGQALVGSMLSSLRDLVDTIEICEAPRRLYSNAVLGYTRAPMRLVGR